MAKPARPQGPPIAGNFSRSTSCGSPDVKMNIGRPGAWSPSTVTSSTATTPTPPCSRGSGRARGGHKAAVVPRASSDSTSQSASSVAFPVLSTRRGRGHRGQSLTEHDVSTKPKIRIFPGHPMTKCVVGEVVFGASPPANTPGSGDFDGDYCNGMFLDTAGLPSWETAAAEEKNTSKSRVMHKHPYAFTQSNVDHVVFGKNIDSGLFMDIIDIHGGAAGHPSWVERPQGLGSSISRRRQKDMKLRRTGRELLARLLGPRSGNKTFARITPQVSAARKAF